MRLSRLIEHGGLLAAKAVARRQKQIAQGDDLPAGVNAQISGDDVVFAGRALKRRYVIDSQFRSKLR